MPGNQNKKKKLICYIGDYLKEECALTWFKSNQSTQVPVTFKEYIADISKHLSSLGTFKDHVTSCPNATEKWLILNRMKLDSIPEEAIICPKHRYKYGTGWKSLASCQYPGHKINSKKSKSQNGRNISTKVASEIQNLFSSAAKKVTVPVGSSWCNNCRLRVHCALKKENNHILESNVCEVCMKNHIEYIPEIQHNTPERELPIATEISTPVLREESASDDNFTDESRKDSFNRSMRDISNEWTPIKISTP